MTLKEQYWEGGNVFQFREGERRMVRGNKLISRHGFVPSNIMSDELVNVDSTVRDEVVAIYEPKAEITYLDEFVKGGKLLWRKSDYMMTIDEIKEKLNIPADAELIIIKEN